MCPPSRSHSTMDLMRSLMSATGKDRSTRALPSTCPSRWKYPTPELNSTTWPIGSCVTAACTSAFAGASATAEDTAVLCWGTSTFGGADSAAGAPTLGGSVEGVVFGWPNTCEYVTRAATDRPRPAAIRYARRIERSPSRGQGARPTRAAVVRGWHILQQDEARAPRDCSRPRFRLVGR